MAALDTNVLVRWLVADDARQTAAADALVAAATEGDQRLFVPVTVLLELEWVLRSRYRFDKATVTRALDALMSVDELEFQDEPTLEQSLWHYRRAGAPDFADCLHVALAGQAHKGPLLTFDKAAAQLQGAELVAS